MTDYLQVSTTTPTREDAVKLLRAAVGAKVAASGQFAGPFGSVFWHLDELGEGEEWQLYLRTTRERYAELEQLLIDEHPWDNPEVTFTSIDGGSQPYLDWLSRMTSA